MLSCSGFAKRDIDDCAKAKGFAKRFTDFRGIWMFCKIIARVVYYLPVSAHEVSTVAYVKVKCALLVYATW